MSIFNHRHSPGSWFTGKISVFQHWELYVAIRRKNKGEAALLGLAIVAGISVYLAIKVSDAIGPIALIFAGAAVLVLVIWYRLHCKAKRLAYLRARHGVSRSSRILCAGSTGRARLPIS